MAKFNLTKTPAKPSTVNLAGGNAYSQSAELELASILLTSFASDQFYRSAEDTFKRLKELIPQCDKKFVAQAAIYARTEFGMRSITHVLGSEVAKYLSGEPWAKNFYERLIYRPDDMMETLSYHITHNGKIPNSMKKGFAKAFDKFDTYSLSKYRAEGKEFKLIDVVNLVHPIPTEKNMEALQALVKGELRSTETWEAKLTQAGQKAENEEEKMELKKDAWKDLIKSKKIGYIALLRNLRNIYQQAPDCIKDACALLTDEKVIKKQLLMPYQFYLAYLEIEKLGTDSKLRMIAEAIGEALDIASSNVPKLDGESCVIFDASGSMDGLLSPKGTITRRQVASVFAAIMAKANNADIMIFGSRAAYVPFNRKDSITTIMKELDKHNRGGGYGWSSRPATPVNGAIQVEHGTDFNATFNMMNKKYDRLFYFSDMGHNFEGTGNDGLKMYRKKFGADPYTYMFDLAGYGTSQFPQGKCYQLAGFSDKVFALISMLERDKNILVNTIKKIEF